MSGALPSRPGSSSVAPTAQLLDSSANRFSAQYASPGRASPMVDGSRHISDLDTEARNQAIAVRNSSLQRHIQTADEAIRLADSLLSFRGSRDKAYVNFTTAVEIMVNLVPSHRDYRDMKIQNGPLWQRNMGLLHIIRDRKERYDNIRDIISNENRRDDIQPRNQIPTPESLTRQQPSPVPSRPESRFSEHDTASSVSQAWFSDGTAASNGVSSETASFAPPTSSTASSVTSEALRQRPPVRPKPDSLHGPALTYQHPQQNGHTASDLAERFSNLRRPTTNLGHSRTTSTSSSVYSGSDNIVRMPSPGDFTPEPTKSPTIGQVPLSLRPSGPRTMPNSLSNGPRIPPKLPLNTELAAALPKPPSPTYSPARNMQTAANVNLPRATPRSAFGTGGRTNSMAASSASSRAPGTDYDSNSYFPAANGSYKPNESRRQGFVGLPPDMRTITAERLFDILKMYNTLLIDVRSRQDFDAGHIDSQSILCIEPLELRRGISADDIQDSISISPDQEQALFYNRDKFDLVVYYDQSTSGFQFLTSPTRNSKEDALKTLFEALTEFNFDKPLKAPFPIFLDGGIDSWERLLGTAALKTSNTAASRGTSLVARKPIPPPVMSHTLSMGKRRRREWNPLDAEEEREWAEQARSESVHMPPMPEEAFETVAEDEPEPSRDFYLNEEEFLRRYPAVNVQRESMMDPQNRDNRPMGVISPRPQQHQNRIPQPQPAPYPSSSPGLHEMPSRPPPAAPRVSYSGAHDRNSMNPYNSSRSQKSRSVRRRTRLAPQYPLA